MDKSIACLRKLFLLLHSEQARDWSDDRRKYSERGIKVSQTAQEVYEMLEKKWEPVSEEELKTWLSAEDEPDVDFVGHQKVLYLPALEKDSDFVPVLSLKIDPSREPRKFALRVMLVSQDKQGDLSGFGFRLESPEGKRDKGRHDFCHAQLIRSFEKGKSPPFKTPECLPDKQPSFPLIAYSPVTLVLSLILTLYGRREYWAFYQRHSAHLHVIKKEMKELDRRMVWQDPD